MARLTALLDANVLYPAGLRDVLRAIQKSRLMAHRALVHGLQRRKVTDNRAIPGVDARQPRLLNGPGDVLLRLADRYLYAPLWSADIHAEWIRNLRMNRPDIEAGVLERTRALMDGHFPDAVVIGYETVAAGLDLPDPGDRHVLAAAIRGQADVIVTGNLRDFPADRLTPHALVAENPDAFIAGLFEADPAAVLAAVRGHRAALRNPPRSAGDHLAALERLGLVHTVSLLRPYESSV